MVALPQRRVIDSDRSIANVAHLARLARSLSERSSELFAVGSFA